MFAQQPPQKKVVISDCRAWFLGSLCKWRDSSIGQVFKYFYTFVHSLFMPTYLSATRHKMQKTPFKQAGISLAPHLGYGEIHTLTSQIITSL
ncbi:hypothetical protein JYQ62_06725 [Nostoc sp. UHCC 0702]|nr:hypothetical protein JYQ62_06725 [Nostoc sp. UHCC 0702]